MSDTTRLWVMIFVGGAGTYLLRSGFLLFASKQRDVPPAIAAALRMIPAAALTALVGTVLFATPRDVLVPSARNLAALIATLVAIKFRRVTLTVLSGLVAVVLLERFGL
jgi:branched-subunit amino acid transport protein